MSRRKVVVFFLALSLLPFPTTVVPEWQLRVTDKEGKPVAGVRARQFWKHYSLAWQGCCPEMEDRWTDANGYVVFPKRTIWAGVLRRIVFPVWAKAQTLAHGSTGIRAYVMISDEYETNNYQPGKPLPNEVRPR